MVSATVADQDTAVVIINQQMFNDKLARPGPFVHGMLNIFVRNIRMLTR